MIINLTMCHIRAMLTKILRGFKLSRPRLIELEYGTVSLQNFPKEVADELSKYIRAFEKPQAVESVVEIAPLVQEQIVIAKAQSPNGIKDKAIGVYFTDGYRNVKLVTVAYDLLSGTAEIDSIQDVPSFKDGSVKFKMAAAKLRFV